MHKIDTEEAMRLCQELPIIRDRLIRAGLIKTGHAMDTAVKEVGYETAEHMGEIG